MPKDIKRVHEMIRSGDLGPDTLNMLAELGDANRPDWNENDPTSDRYIANKPGGYSYETNTYETSGIAKKDRDGYFYIDIDAPGWILEGSIFNPPDIKVRLDGEIYENLSFYASGNTCVIGNRKLMKAPTGVTITQSEAQDAVLFALYSADKTSFTKLYVKTPGTHVIKISKYETAPILTGTITSGARGGETIGYQATAEGIDNVSSGRASHAEGYQTTASEATAHSEGSNTVASGTQSHAEGKNTIASGNVSHAEGDQTTALAGASHAEGNQTTATGDCSHAEGSSTTASGGCAHSEGFQTTASGNFSHAEGSSNIASAQNAHAEGGGTIASGMSSHAEGLGTTAVGQGQHVGGMYNVVEPSGDSTWDKGTYAEIIGNGTSQNDRSNARTLDWSGNEWLAGTLKLGGTSATDSNAVDVLAAISGMGAGGGSMEPIALALAANDRITYDQFNAITGKTMQDLDVTGAVWWGDPDVYYVYGYSGSTNVQLSEIQDVDGVLTMPQFVINGQDDTVIYRIRSLYASMIIGAPGEPSTITKLIIPYGYKKIGDPEEIDPIGFGSYETVLPDSIEEIGGIGGYHVRNCYFSDNLKKIHNFASIYPIPDDQGAVTISLPGGISIGSPAFEFPNDVTTVNVYFRGTPEKIGSVANLEYAGEGAFYTAGSHVEHIRSYVPWPYYTSVDYQEAANYSEMNALLMNHANDIASMYFLYYA